MSLSSSISRLPQLLFLILFTALLVTNVRYVNSASLFMQGLVACSGVLWLACCLLYSCKTKLLFITFLLNLLSLSAYKELLAVKLELSSFVIISNTWLLLYLSSQSEYGLLRIASRVLVTIFVISSVVILLTGLYYGSLDKEFVFALLQTNTQEASEFLGYIAEPKAFIILAISVVLTGFWLRYSVNKKRANSPLFALVLIPLSFFSLLQPNTFKGFSNVLSHIEQYYFELEQLRAVIDKRKSSASKYSVTTSSENSLHLLVIGESLSRFHMFNYGYRRETTPWIAQSQPIQLQYAYSNHTHTMEVLTLALTQSNQYNQLDYFASASLIDVLNQVGFQTAWISNQMSAGEWDNHVSALAFESDYVRFINTNVGRSDFSRKQDDALIDELRGYLATQDLNKNHFIVLHMMGSHIAYCDRIKGQARSLPPAPNYLYKGKQNDCYDETVAFADRILSQVYELVSNTPHFSSMTFFSDHGEEVFEKLGHDSRRFKETMAEIPFLVWSKEPRPNLVSNQDKVFTNDLLFDYLLGITKINSDLKEEHLDIGSDRYSLPLHQAKTLHASLPISSLSRHKTKVNLNKNKNLMAHRVNTIGAMDDAKHQGFQRIELDLIISDGIMQVGHDHETLTGQSLEAYLAYENRYFEALWFDIKNINEQNLSFVLGTLENLDSRYQLKRRTLIETSSISPRISELSEKGWKTSYYLPTSLPQRLTSQEQTLAYVSQLQDQLKSQQMRSLSYDISLFEFVDKYLLDSIIKPLGLKMNTWTPLKAKDSALLKKLEKLGANQGFENVIVIHTTRFRL
ncbi:MAG: phosphoethanolamine transferase [Vibrio sp.]|uniref:phosphoethanolamine transferase n=1 Tax=Vibrio TaxID=662 RepID=UPI001EC13E63|nr:phosphoethanolamine transferase [Vibrio sp.]NRB68797.1 phosphoethanolamine transferase [Vibrio sp.]